MSKSFKTFFAAGLFLITVPASQAAVKFGLAGAVDYNMAKSTITIGSDSTELKGGLGFGGGLVMDIGKFGLSAIYISRATTTTGSLLGISFESSSSSGILHIPLVYRIGLGGASLNLGGFFGLGLGSGGGSDYGATGGFRFGKKLFIDLSYNMGLKGETDAKSKAAIALIGTMF
jgi:hypothetical protein